MEYANHLTQIVVLLSAAVCVVTIFKRLNLSPVFGYLVAGAAIGEYGFNFVRAGSFSTFTELAIVFLLFTIGLEFTFERLKQMRLYVFGFGTLQVLITASAITMACAWWGIALSTSIVIGAALALSSTAIVIKILTESQIHTSQVGRLSIANLLMQDIMVIPLLIAIPIMSQQGGTDVVSLLSEKLIQSIVALIAIILVGRLLLRPLFDSIASSKSNELFVAATLLVVLGTAFITHHFGLPVAIGAFIAGLLVAETQYQSRVEDSILPFKDLLMGLFFMVIGMNINISSIYDNLAIVLFISFLLIISKTLIISFLARLFGFSRGASLHSALLLSQGSEFAFILFTLAAHPEHQLLPPYMAETLLMAVTISMAITPLLSKFGHWVNTRLDHTRSHDIASGSDEIDDLEQHTAIIGFGHVGRMVASFLTHKKIHYIAIDADIKVVNKARANGSPVYHGDGSKIEPLKATQLDRAKAAVVTIPDPFYLKRCVQHLHKHYPNLPIVVRVKDFSQAKSLRKLGSNIIIAEKYEVGLQLATTLLNVNGIPEDDAMDVKRMFRRKHYEVGHDETPLQDHDEPPATAKNPA